MSQTRSRVMTSRLLLCATLTALSLTTFADSRNWMSQIPSNRIMNQLIIPGTHDSGTYAINDASKFSLSSDDPLPLWIEQISNILPPSLVQMIVAGWSKTQPYAITDQLNNGIRYLDFRVCYFQTHMVLCHALVSVNLSDALQQINQFVTNNPSEIIVLDINHIYNVNNAADEAQLLQLLSDQLGTNAIPNTYHATDTIGTLRQSKHNVIILMDTNQPITDPALQQFAAHYLWHQSTINSPWPNKTNVADLKNTLDVEMAMWHKIHASAQNFFVLQAIQTPGTNQIINGIINPFWYPSSIQNYEIPVNQALNGWLTGYISAYGPRSINIVIQDWFDNTSTLVPLAIQYDTQASSPLDNITRPETQRKLDALRAWYKGRVSVQWQHLSAGSF